MSNTEQYLDSELVSSETSVIRRKQLKYVTSLAHIAEFSNLEGVEVFPTGDSLRSVAKIADGGIVFNKTLYKLPHTAAIACQNSYFERWKPVDGWKFWSLERNGKEFTLDQVRDEFLDSRMTHGDYVKD